MRKPIQCIFLAICLTVGVLEMNPLLIGIGVVGFIAVVIGLLGKAKENREERQRRLELTVGLNQYLERYHFLEISDHVTLRAQGVLDDFGDVLVYYDEELVGSLNDFNASASFEDTYEKMEKKVRDVSLLGAMVDENHNGIDDRLEEDRKAAYYIREIKRCMRMFDNPGISAGLEDITELLGQIESLEKKYPQISPRLRKLYQHYLPLLMNILDQYQTLKDKQASESEITVMESRLEKTIMLVNEALKTLMASFISDDLLNMSSDITVLEAILKRDGLIKEGTLGGMPREQ